jgi:hypothetical protein
MGGPTTDPNPTGPQARIYPDPGRIVGRASGAVLCLRAGQNSSLEDGCGAGFC